MGIIVELLQSNNQSEKTFGAIILYQYIREHLNTIIESQSLFNQYKDIFLNKILPLIVNGSPIIIDKICSSTTIILIIGLLSYWPEAINYMLQYATVSHLNCYIATIVLSNCKQELNDIYISKKKIYMIESSLIDKKEDIKLFIKQIIQQTKNISDQEFGKNLYMKTIELIKSWAKYEINILSLPEMTQSLLLSMNTGNMEQLAQLFEESISYCKSAKIQTFQESTIEESANKSNKEEMTSIRLLIDIIKQYVITYMDNKNKQQSNKANDVKVMHSLAKIFSSLTENFIFLFFLKNDTSRDLFDLLYYFLSSPNRAISSKLFEGIHEMKIFINTDYKLSNLSNEEKVEFSNYLMRLTQAVMGNCKLKSFPKLVNANSNMTNNPNPNANTNINTNNQIMELENDQNEYEISNNEISINNYRSNAEDVFVDLFTIFSQNFKDEGVFFFLKNITQILIDLNINDDSIFLDTNRLLIVETVLFTVRNLIDYFEALKHKEALIEFIRYILSLKVINNEYIRHAFILFLDSSSINISYDLKLYEDINRFLIITSKYKPLEKLSTTILCKVNDYSNVYSLEVVKLLYQFYQEQFKTLDTLSLCNVAEGICASVAILDKDKNLISMPLSDVAKYYNELLQYIIGQIEAIVQEIKSKLGDNANSITVQSISNINDIVKELSKLYSIISAVFKQVNFLDNDDFLWEIFQNHFRQNKNTFTIFNLFANNMQLITQITIFYNKITSKIGTKCLSVFGPLNALMLNSYAANPDNFDSLSVLSNLYSQAGPLSEETKRYVSNIFFPLINQICLNIQKNKNHQIEVASNFANFFSHVLSLIDYSDLNYETNLMYLDQAIDLMIEVFKNIIENSLINYILKAFNAFITAKNIPLEFIGNKYNKIISEVFECFDHFCSVTINHFTIFTCLCMRVNSNAFLINLKRVLEGEQFRMLKLEHVQLVIDYFHFSNYQEIMIKKIMNDLVNITRGMGQVDQLNHYAFEMARAKITKA